MMKVTNLYCKDCTNRFQIEGDTQHLRLCPTCASQNVSVFEQKMDYHDRLYMKVIDPILADSNLNFIEKAKKLEELAAQLKDIAFHHKFGPLLQVLREIEHGW